MRSDLRRLRPAHEDDRRLPPRERLVFVEVGEGSAAIPLSALAHRHEVRIKVGGQPLVVRLGTVGADVPDERGRLVPFSEPFWFAVAAFCPKVVLHR